MAVSAAPLLAAGPVEFGLAEVERAIAARGLRPGAIRFNTEINADAPDAFRIRPGVIAGGDLRGLMYGLLEAADQIRETGRLANVQGAPAVSIRSVRRTLSAGELEQEWSASPEYWRNYVSMLARNRFNRLTLVFPLRSAAWRDVLRAASTAAAEFGLELALGVRPQAPPLDELRQALRSHASLRTVQASEDAPLEWYADLLGTVAHAGRLVTADIPSSNAADLAAANPARAAVRVFAPYWPGGLAHPYQPAETFPGRSYLNLLERPQPYAVYWDLGAGGDRRRLLWGDADFVRRAVATFELGGAAGFEIDAPGWRDFDRHWLFYLLWGRLAYDPKTPDKVWLSELKRRYGAASAGVQTAYEAASGAFAEIAAANLDFPLDAWRNARPADWRTTASVAEAVQNRLRGAASAKDTPFDVAERLLDYAVKLDAAIASARGKIADGARDWASAVSDFETIVPLSRYHAHRHLAVVHAAWFDETGDGAALASAQREIAAAREAWDKLSAAPEGAAITQKLPAIADDARSIAGRARIFEQWGPFEIAFDFGPPRRASVAPRFDPVDPEMEFTEARGYGWVVKGGREAGADPAGASLYGDWIRGAGAQRFRLRAADGSYQVLLVNPKGPAASRTLRTRNGALDVVFPVGEWTVSGVVVKRESGGAAASHRPWPKRAPRPKIAHEPPKTAQPGRPFALSLRLVPSTGVKTVRLHYRPVNQLAKFKTIENSGAKGAFTIPADDLSARWDLMYYFEIMTQDSGWLEPDPRAATPYYVVRVEERQAAPAP